jgi:hypothetical protein
MTTQQAIRILMLSPCYWLLRPAARLHLIREFLQLHALVHRSLSHPPATDLVPQPPNEPIL